MKRHLLKLILTSGCAVLAPHAIAQSSTPAVAATTQAPASTSATTTPTLTPAGPAKPQAVAVNVRAANPASVRTVHAAGSVIILADGIVANAAVAQIQPPAPGFVYER